MAEKCACPGEFAYPRGVICTQPGKLAIAFDEGFVVSLKADGVGSESFRHCGVRGEYAQLVLEKELRIADQVVPANGAGGNGREGA